MQDNTQDPIIDIGTPSTVDPIQQIVDSQKRKHQNKVNTNLDKATYELNQEKEFLSAFDTFEPRKASFQNEGFQIQDAYTKLSNGNYITRYDDFLQGSDNEDRHAQNQSTSSKWLNGLSKFGLKTINNAVGGTLGTVWGAISAISEGNWERIYDNEFYDFLDDQNTKLDNFQANYKAQEERDLNIFQSMGTANFWADDFLGGMSFMAGTVISESLWAVGTGGASLTTTAARVGLRASKYFNGAKLLVSGVKNGQKTARKYLRADAVLKASQNAVKYGKAGEIANLARFTYTGAGFEAGMEARLYQKEQRENFDREFRTFNGRIPSAEETAEFENNLDKTTNTLWATNMALVGTSNFAILGKTFGVSSPFKLPSKNLDRVVFGNGVKTSLGEAGERIGTEAIKRSKFQRGLGFSKGLLKNPFYEGIIEEGGQATASTAMESYLTSRYNPSKEAMGMAESMYEGLSHTYGTKEGWKEVGLGMLIGLVGGESTSALSGNGVLRDARNAGKEFDPESVEKAKVQNEHTGTNTIDKIFATRFEENLNQATQIQDAQAEYESAEKSNDIMGMATAQGKVMLSSLVSAVNMDYLGDQISDFEAALKMQTPEKIAEHYGIEENQVDSKIDELVGQYKQMGQDYKSAKEFADYMISDNPKELFEDATEVNVADARGAIAYQMVMTGIIENNMEAAHESLVSSVSELSPQLSGKFMQALNRYNQINRSKKADVQAVAKVENKLKLKQQQLERLNKQLLKTNQVKAKADDKSSQKSADRYNNLSNKIVELEQEIGVISKELGEKNGLLDSKKKEMSNLNASTRELASQLDIIDPLAGQDLVSEMTIEETQKRLEELDNTLKQVQKTNPQLAEKILKLGEEYKKGLEMWKRNADTIADLTDPNLGLKRIGSLIQKKKEAGATTLEFLKRLQKTNQEETDFLAGLQDIVNPTQEDAVQEEFDENISEQEKADNSQGEDVLQEDIQEQDPVKRKIAELKALLKGLVGKNSFLLDNFSDNAQQLSEEKAPTQEELDEYNEIRDKFKSGDINKLVGRPIDAISKRIKERSGLTDKEIQRYQELSQKMVNWRVVTGTNANGISVQDILNQIDAYNRELQNIDEQVSTEQVLEMTEQGQSEFSVDISDPDYVNSMDKVNIKQDKIQTTISHLKMSTIENSDFNVTYLREDNRGTESQPDLAAVYQLEKNGKTFEIQYTNDHHRVVVGKNNTEAFLNGMGMQTVKYNTKTGWGYVFKDGVPMQSDFGINLINNPEINILNPQLIYELLPGDKVSFSVNMQDIYNNETIVPLIQEGKIEEAKKLMSIYIVDKNGAVLGFLKSGVKAEGSNFNKVRQEALNVLQERLNNSEVTLEDLANDNTNSVLNLPFEVEVEKTFVGTPNIELDQNRNVKSFKITEEQSKSIVGFGYAENGTIKEDKDVRRTFIPKNKNTPYVVIQHGNTKVAFPVGMASATTSLKDKVIEILNSNSREQDKVTNVIKLLKENGVEPAQFDIGGLKDNSNELNKLFKFLDNSKRAYTKSEINNLTKEEFISASEIVIDLNKPAFVSPKVKTSLSKKLIDKRTGKSSATKKLTESERQDLLIQHLLNTSKAKTAEEVLQFVMETGDEVFIKEFLENSKFKKQVIDASLANKVVPTINTESTLENLLQDVVDLTSVDIPLDIRDKFEQEVQDLQSNPTKAKLKSLAKKVMKSIENRYKLIKSSINTNNLYHIPTTETEEQMFEQGYVRVIGDFYKKVDKKYNLQQLLEGLYNKYKNNALPNHLDFANSIDLIAVEDLIRPNGNIGTQGFTSENMIEVIKFIGKEMGIQLPSFDKNSSQSELKQLIEFLKNNENAKNLVLEYVKKDPAEINKLPDDSYHVQDGNHRANLLNLIGVKVIPALSSDNINSKKEFLSLEDFITQMPNTLLDVYKLYYNSQPVAPVSKKAAIVGNDQYLREEFKGDFAQFIQQEKNKGSKLYKEVLQHFQITDKGILKDDLLTRDKINEFENELGENYRALLNYSLINKHIDLQEQPQSLIFVEDIDNINRLQAVNNPNLPKPKAKATIINDKTISFSKVNQSHIQYKDGIYEKVHSNKQGDYVYERISTIDPNFIITEVAPPFSTITTEITKEIDTTKTNINETKGSKIDC